MTSAARLEVRVKGAVWEAPGIVSYELRNPDGSPLPPFTAGAHVDLELPNGLMRSYSLLNDQAERERYVIAVQNDRATRGGSKWIHDNLRPGDMLQIAGPRNNFPLDETAAKSIFIAGGIGITPIMSMTARLTSLGRDWELFYCARTRAGAAFVDRLQGNVRFNFDGEPGGKVLDIGAVVSAAPPGAHFYCCGPAPMLSAFEGATARIGEERVHLEYFTSKAPAALAGGFKVVLARSNREFEIAPGKTILDTLVEDGFDIPYSCMEGVCASCETKIIEGVPDHRDAVLSQKEREEGKTMMICCSGSKTERLVLDL